jgi:hypothetical protein
MAITYVGGATGQAGNGAAITVDLTALTGGSNSAPSAGDIVLVVHAAARAYDTPAALTLSTSGYSAIASGLYAEDSGAATLFTFYKVMGSTPDTSLVTNGTGVTTNSMTCCVHVWRGFNSSNIFDVTTTTATGANTNRPTPPAITPTTSGSVIVCLATSGGGGDQTLTNTDLSNFRNISRSDTYNGRSGIGSYAWSSGTFTPAKWSTSVSEVNTAAWCAVTLALRPAPVAPTVTTQDVSSIAATTATGNGTVTSDGGATITERGVCWNTSTGPTTANSKATSAGTTGAFTASMTSLSAGTLYYVRAYAINSIGTSYGSEVTFTTLTTPTVTTQDVTDVTSSGFTGNGNITATGGVNATRRGFCYKVGVSGDPTTADSVAYDDGSYGTGAYTKAVTGLSSNTGYRVRAYAVNSVGTSYGSTVQATTLAAAPANLKTYNTNLAANIKSINTNLIANVKSLNTNT